MVRSTLRQLLFTSHLWLLGRCRHRWAKTRFHLQEPRKNVLSQNFRKADFSNISPALSCLILNGIGAWQHLCKPLRGRQKIAKKIKKRIFVLSPRTSKLLKISAPDTEKHNFTNKFLLNGAKHSPSTPFHQPIMASRTLSTQICKNTLSPTRTQKKWLVTKFLQSWNFKH